MDRKENGVEEQGFHLIPGQEVIDRNLYLALRNKTKLFSASAPHLPPNALVLHTEELKGQ